MLDNTEQVVKGDRYSGQHASRQSSKSRKTTVKNSARRRSTKDATSTPLDGDSSTVDESSLSGPGKKEDVELTTCNIVNCFGRCGHYHKKRSAMPGYEQRTLNAAQGKGKNAGKGKMELCHIDSCTDPTHSHSQAQLVRYFQHDDEEHPENFGVNLLDPDSAQFKQDFGGHAEPLEYKTDPMFSLTGWDNEEKKHAARVPLNYDTVPVVTHHSTKAPMTPQTHEHTGLPFDGVKYLHCHVCEVCKSRYTHTHKRKPALVSSTHYRHWCPACEKASASTRHSNDFNGVVLDHLKEVKSSVTGTVDQGSSPPSDHTNTASAASAPTLTSLHSSEVSDTPILVTHPSGALVKFPSVLRQIRLFNALSADRALQHDLDELKTPEDPIDGLDLLPLAPPAHAPFDLPGHIPLTRFQLTLQHFEDYYSTENFCVDRSLLKRGGLPMLPQLGRRRPRSAYNTPLAPYNKFNLQDRMFRTPPPKPFVPAPSIFQVYVDSGTYEQAERVIFSNMKIAIRGKQFWWRTSWQQSTDRAVLVRKFRSASQLWASITRGESNELTTLNTDGIGFSELCKLVPLYTTTTKNRGWSEKKREYETAYSIQNLVEPLGFTSAFCSQIYPELAKDLLQSREYSRTAMEKTQVIRSNTLISLRDYVMKHEAGHSTKCEKHKEKPGSCNSQRCYRASKWNNDDVNQSVVNSTISYVFQQMLMRDLFTNSTIPDGEVFRPENEELSAPNTTRSRGP